MSTSDITQLRAGFFGKLPALGDFVSRQLAYAQVRRIDDWMQCGLRALQRTSTRGGDAELGVPVWRFVLPCGVWGGRAFCGALMPSLDKVGRRFPLLACVGLDADTHLAAVSPFSERLAQVLPNAIACELGPDDLLARLQQAINEVAAEEVSSLPGFSLTGHQSLWWSSVTDSASRQELIHHGEPDAHLFVRLFKP